MTPYQKIINAIMGRHGSGLMNQNNKCNIFITMSEYDFDLLIHDNPII